MKLSLVMIVKNEEKHIRKCIQHAKKYVDEIIVGDTGSTDRTKEILGKLPVKVIDIPWNGHFAEARNKVIEHATGDWILVLDADETVTYFDREAIEMFVQTAKIGRIRIKSRFQENGVTKEAVSYVSRLFPKGTLYTGRIHEQLDSKCERKHVAIHVNHSGYFKTNKGERNIPLLLQAAEEHPNDPYYQYQLGREYSKSEELEKAIYHFSLFFESCDYQTLYAKEGVVGYLYALLEAKRYDVALKVIQTSSSYMKGYPDFHFVSGLFYMEYVQQDSINRLGHLSDIERSYQACLEIGDDHPYGGVKGTGTFLAAYNLGLYYELMDGIIANGAKKAQEMYQYAAKWKYEPAMRRLKTIKKG